MTSPPGRGAKVCQLPQSLRELILPDGERITSKPVLVLRSNSEIRTAFRRSSSSIMRNGKLHRSMWITLGGHPNRSVSTTNSGQYPVHGSTLETERRAAAPSVERGSRPVTASLGVRSTPGFGGELIHGREVRLFELGMLIEDLLLAHSGAQPAQYVPNRDTQSANTGLSAALTWFNSDPGGRCWHEIPQSSIV